MTQVELPVSVTSQRTASELVVVLTEPAVDAQWRNLPLLRSMTISVGDSGGICPGPPFLHPGCFYIHFVEFQTGCAVASQGEEGSLSSASLLTLEGSLA